MSARLVSIIGPPASGKTMLADYLSAELPAGMIKEDYEGNPFLAESYAGTESLRLPSQLYFLMSRVKQFAAADWPDEGLLVSDYGFCQDALYAKLRLSEDDYGLYQRVAAAVAGAVKAPDVMIVLDASVESLLDRISMRGRGYERSMSDQFLQSMRAEYLADWAAGGASVLRIDTDIIDLRLSRECAAILSQVREKL